LYWKDVVASYAGQLTNLKMVKITNWQQRGFKITKIDFKQLLHSHLVLLENSKHEHEYYHHKSRT